MPVSSPPPEGNSDEPPRLGLTCWVGNSVGKAVAITGVAAWMGIASGLSRFTGSPISNDLLEGFVPVCGGLVCASAGNPSGSCVD